MSNDNNVSYTVTTKKTPWDSSVFNLDTFEIELNVNNSNSIDRAVSELSLLTNVQSPSVFYCRIDANNRYNKATLIKAHFFNCETQLHITNKLSEKSIPKELGARRLPIKVANIDDYIEVCEKASKTFNYSRFHEDPFVDVYLANQRMESWCRDMQNQNVPLLVSRGKNGDLDSFIFYKLNGEKSVELVLGGSLPGKGALTPLFWASFMEYIRASGIEYIETKISASNVAIVNIYSFFNFKIKSTYFDFHKHVNCNILR
jgi:hypothetical protein